MPHTIDCVPALPLNASSIVKFQDHWSKQKKNRETGNTPRWPRLSFAQWGDTWRKGRDPKVAPATLTERDYGQEDARDRKRNRNRFGIQKLDHQNFRVKGNDAFDDSGLSWCLGWKQKGRSVFLQIPPSASIENARPVGHFRWYYLAKSGYHDVLIIILVN